jgi:hypothetical protein
MKTLIAVLITVALIVLLFIGFFRGKILFSDNNKKIIPIAILIAMVITILLFGFTGCSGKKQVNPLPDGNKKNIPERELILTNGINKAYIEDFDNYASTKLKREKGIETIKNTWDIGLERGHK